MKKLIISLSFVLTAFATQAQGLLYENSFFNLTATNPAFAGVRKDFNLDGLDGVQFLGGNMLSPQQRTQVIALDGQVGQHSNGLGFQAFNNNLLAIGSTLPTNTQGVLMDYAYRSALNDNLSVSVGLRAGFTYTPGFYTKQFFPYAGAGLLLNSDEFYLSLSKPIIIASESVFSNINQKSFFGGAGYSFEPNENIMFNPSFQYEINPSNGNSFNVGAKVWFSRKFGIGAVLRQKNESFANNTPSYTKFLGMFEFQASKSIRVGLSYDRNPFAGFMLSNSANFSPDALFQLYFKYVSTSERENTNRLKYF